MSSNAEYVEPAEDGFAEELAMLERPAPSFARSDRFGNRAAYDALIRSLEPFPTIRTTVLQWGTEFHKRPDDEIWEIMSAVFLAQTWGALAAGGEKAIPTIVAEAVTQQNTKMTMLTERFDEILDKPIIVPRAAIETAVQEMAEAAAQKTLLAYTAGRIGDRITRRDAAIAVASAAAGAIITDVVSHSATVLHPTAEAWLLSFIVVVAGWVAALFFFRRSAPAIADFAGGALAIAVIIAAAGAIFHA
jgi:hypothetical protein